MCVLCAQRFVLRRVLFLCPVDVFLATGKVGNLSLADLLFLGHIYNNSITFSSEISLSQQLWFSTRRVARKDQPYRILGSCFLMSTALDEEDVHVLRWITCQTSVTVTKYLRQPQEVGFILAHGFRYFQSLATVSWLHYS